jgi:hypothetical protein
MKLIKGFDRLFLVLCTILIIPTTLYMYSARNSWKSNLALKNKEYDTQYTIYQSISNERLNQIEKEFFENISSDEKKFLEENFGKANIIKNLLDILFMLVDENKSGKSIDGKLLKSGRQSYLDSATIQTMGYEDQNKTFIRKKLIIKYEGIKKKYSEISPPKEYLYPSNTILFLVSIFAGIVSSTIAFITLKGASRVIKWIAIGFKA